MSDSRIRHFAESHSLLLGSKPKLRCSTPHFGAAAFDTGVDFAVKLIAAAAAIGGTGGEKQGEGGGECGFHVWIPVNKRWMQLKNKIRVGCLAANLPSQNKGRLKPIQTALRLFAVAAEVVGLDFKTVFEIQAVGIGAFAANVHIQMDFRCARSRADAAHFFEQA